MSERRIAKGLRQYNREDKAAKRRNDAPRASDFELARKRAGDRVLTIDERLGNLIDEGDTSKLQVIELQAEKIWLRFALGDIDSNEKLQLLQRLLGGLPKQLEDKMYEDKSDGLNLMEHIKNRVINPITGRLDPKG